MLLLLWAAAASGWPHCCHVDAATAMSRAVTCVTGAARDETAAPHDGRGVHVHANVDAVAAVGVADRWVAAPIVRYVVRAVAAAVVAHDGDPWPPGCSWSDCPVRGSAEASDSWDKRFADATRSLQREWRETWVN